MSHFAAWTPIAPTAGEALFVAPSPGSTHELLTRSFPRAALLLLGCQLVWVCIRGGRRLFFGRHGRWHRLPGLAYVLWLALECTQLCAGPKFVAPVIFDAVLGALGVLLTVSAAVAFKNAHELVENPASGTLEETATVSYAEMVEHAFYQGLNLAQVLYLHIVWQLPSQHLRAALALAVAIPWWFRGRFPVNRFSDNYSSEGTARTVVGVMYRVKKWQYLAYKHVLLHGLNVTVAMTGVRLAGTPAFQLYWLLLNTAYVMEFFLQTLVRRRHMGQTRMLFLNQLIMLASTAAAVPVFLLVHPAVALLSLALNFANRHHEIGKMALVIVASLLLT